MIGQVAALNKPEIIISLMADIATDGKIDTPELAALMIDLGKTAAEALA